MIRDALRSWGSIERDDMVPLSEELGLYGVGIDESFTPEVMLSPRSWRHDCLVIRLIGINGFVPCACFSELVVERALLLGLPTRILPVPSRSIVTAHNRKLGDETVIAEYQIVRLAF